MLHHVDLRRPRLLSIVSEIVALIVIIIHFYLLYKAIRFLNANLISSQPKCISNLTNRKDPFEL